MIVNDIILVLWRTCLVSTHMFSLSDYRVGQIEETIASTVLRYASQLKVMNLIISSSNPGASAVLARAILDDMVDMAAGMFTAKRFFEELASRLEQGHPGSTRAEVQRDGGGAGLRGVRPALPRRRQGQDDALLPLFPSELHLQEASWQQGLPMLSLHDARR